MKGKVLSRLNLTLKDAIFFLLVFILGMALRIFWVFKIKNSPISDFAEYYQIALNISQGLGHTYNGYPIAFRGMAYPYILALFFHLTRNNSVFAAEVLNLIFSLFSLILIFFIILKLSKSNLVRKITFVIAAFLPNYIAYNSTIGTEVFALFLLVLVIFLQLYPFNSKIYHPLIGALIGISALNRPFFLGYPMFWGLIEYLKTKDAKKSLINFFIVSTFTCLTILPWTIRNYKIYHRLIPISYNGGYILYVNNNDQNIHGGWQSIATIQKPPEMIEDLKKAGFTDNSILEIEQDSVLKNPDLEPIFAKYARRWIIDNPYKFILLGLIRVKNVFFAGAPDVFWWTADVFRSGDAPFPRLFNLIKGLSDALIYILSFFGFYYAFSNSGLILLNFKNKKGLPFKILIPVINFFFFFLVYFIFEGQPRYNFPLLFIFGFVFAECIYTISRSNLLKDG